MIDNRILNGQRAHLLVTGASSGIGRALAMQLAHDGHDVVAIGRDAARLAALKSAHANIEIVPFDLAHIDEIGDLVSDLTARFPSIEGLINNAAIQNDRRIDDAGYGDADIAHEIAIDLTAPIMLARGFLPHLQGRSRAAIVNVTTGLAFVPKRTSAVYSASKAGLHLFSEALRVQLRGSNVRVVEAVMPMVDTPMTAGHGFGKISADAAAQAVRAGMWRGPETIFVGKAKLLPPLLRFAPGVAARILQRN